VSAVLAAMKQEPADLHRLVAVSAHNLPYR
jgi:hypothetical protein